MGKKDGAKNRRKSERFESEETLNADAVAGYLEGLAKSLRDGKVLLGEEGAHFETMVSGDVELEVEARRRKKKSRIELTLSFRTGELAVDGMESQQDTEAAPEAAATIPDEMSF